MSNDLTDLFMSMDDNDIQNREEIVRSPLHYMGSKKDSLDWILNLLPYETTWVDVFGGSGVVTLNRKPSKLDVFNDRHSGISAFFMAVKENPDLLIEHIRTIPHGRELFAWCKDNVERTTFDHFVRGAMFYCLVQYSFAGCTRTFGRATKTPIQLYDRISNQLDSFYHLSNRFQKVQVENLDWRMMLKDYDTPSTTFYLDPPYYQSNVYKYGMSESEHLEMCSKIFNCQGFVALSGFENPVYDKFPWDGIHCFDLKNKCATAAYTTAEGNMEGKEHIDGKSGTRREFLFIKEAYA